MGTLKRAIFRVIERIIFTTLPPNYWRKWNGKHTEDGKELPGIIKEENDTTFIVDCNHPLADKTLEVELTIRNIE